MTSVAKSGYSSMRSEPLEYHDTVYKVHSLDMKVGCVVLIASKGRSDRSGQFTMQARGGHADEDAEDKDDRALLAHLEQQLARVRQLKAQAQLEVQRVESDRRQLEQHARREQRQRESAATSTSRIEALQAQERARREQADARRGQEERAAREREEEARRRRQVAIEARAVDDGDLDAFLADDAALF